MPVSPNTLEAAMADRDDLIDILHSEVIELLEAASPREPLNDRALAHDLISYLIANPRVSISLRPEEGA